MLVQKIEMVYESSDERALSIPDFFNEPGNSVVTWCYPGMVLSNVSNNLLVVAVSVLRITIGLIHLLRYSVHHPDGLSANCRTYMK